MIRHMVMWKLVEDGAEPVAALSESIAEALRGMAGRIPGLVNVQAFSNTLNLEGNWDLVLIADLEDTDALDRYQSHPVHVAVAQRIKAKATSRAAVDFEV